LIVEYKPYNCIRFRIDYKTYAQVKYLNDYTVKIETIITDTKYRNKGYASLLMEGIITYLKNDSIELIKLEVHPLDKSDGLNKEQLYKFYKKWGFVNLSPRLMILEFN